MTLRQQAGAVLVSGSLLTGAASAVSLPDGRTLPADEVRILAGAAAQAPCPVDWRDLLAIRTVESGSAVLHADGRVLYEDGTPVRGDGGLSYGPFQFYESAGTWDRYGNGGDPDRLDDSAAATARMLCSNNIDEDRRTAIRSHNGSGPAAERYADRVLELADALPGVPPATGAPSTRPAGPQPSSGPQSGHQGVTLRITDAVIGQALDGWATLNGRAQARSADAPDLARFFALADQYQQRYTGGAGKPVADPPQVPVASSAQMVCPIAGPVEHRPDFGDPRSGGRSHQGNDLMAAHGTPVVAPFDGLVTDVADDEGSAGLGGLALWITAEGGPLSGWQAYLAHNARNVAARGQVVKAGQVVAFVGDTGNASADSPHVHFQLHPGGGPPVDPWPYASAACAANRKVST